MKQIIIANILSIIASISYIVGLKRRDTKKMILCFNINTFLHIVSNFILQAYTAVIVGITNIIRNKLTEKKKLNIWTVLLLIIINFAFSYSNIRNMIDIFPIIGTTMNTFGFLYLSESKTDERIKEINFKLTKTVASVFWVIYYASILNISASIFEASFIIVGLYVVIKNSFEKIKEPVL